MSSVDKRVVQMVFDNDKFEKNLEQSQKSLESIDKQINNLGKNVSGDNLASAVTKGMDEATRTIELKGEIIRGIMQRIGGTIAEFFVGTFQKAQQAINSLSFDQIDAGFSKYEEKLSSVQTIMNATGKSIEFVEEQMEKLNWYTDETSANFTDMTNNIGKFTSAGIELEEASQAMMGISNWAYLSGANLQQASAAMYNFSQAMGAGAMQSQDWKSIENANMATAAFKETVILTTKELYKEGKIQEDVIEKYGVTVENFRNTLKDKWFDSTVMMESTKIYGQYSNYVKEIQDNGTKVISQSIKDAYKKANDEEISFSLASGVVEYLDWVQETYTQEMTDIIEKYGADSKELKKITSDLGISVEQALDMTKVTTNLKGEAVTGYFYNISRSAFLAAQEYKTFADVISATADAVSTKWMNIFQIIFGNYEEAKSIWSEFGDLFYDIFAQPVDNLLTIVEAWQRFNGQVLLFGTETSSVFTNLRDIFYTIKEALELGFLDVLKQTFPELSSLRQAGMQLAYLTFKINNACEQLKEALGGITDESKTINAAVATISKITGMEFPKAMTMADKIRSATRGVFKILVSVGRVLKSLAKGFARIVKAILPSFDTILDLFVTVDEQGDVLEQKSIQIAKTIEMVCKIIAALITKFKQSVMDGSIIEYLTNLGKFLLGSVINFIKGFFTTAQNETNTFAGGIQKAGNTVLTTLQTVANFIFTKLTDAYNKFMQTGFGQALARLFAQLPTLISNVGKLIVGAMTQIINLFAAGAEMVNRFFASFKNSSLGDGSASGTGMGILGMLFILIQSIVAAVMEGKAISIMDSISEAIDGITETLETFQASLKAEILTKIGLSLVEIAIAAMMLASIPADRLKVTMLIMGGTLVALLGSMAIISSMTSSKVGASGLAGMMKQLTSVAMSMLILAAVITKFGKMDPDELILGLAGLAGVFAEVVILLGGLRLTTASFSKQTVIKYKGEMQAMTQMMKSMIIMVLALNMLRPSIKALGKLPKEELEQGVSGMMFLTFILISMMTAIRLLANPGKTMLDLTGVQIFYKNIVAIAATFGIVTVAIGVLTASLVVLSGIPPILLLQGYLSLSFLLKWVGKLFKLTTKMMANLANSSHIIASGAGVMQVATALIMITVAINLLLIPLETMAYTPLPLLVKGGVATILLMSWMVIFLGALVDIVSGRSLLGGKGMASYIRVEKWAADIFYISIALVAIAGAIDLLMVPVKQFATMTFSELGRGFVGLLASIFLVFIFISGLMAVNAAFKSMPDSFATTVLSVGGALLLIAAGMDLIADVIQKFGEMDKDVYEAGMVKMGEVAGWILMLTAVFALISTIVKIGARKFGDATGIAKSVFFIGVGLLSFAGAIMLLLLPLDILSKIKDPTVYYEGINRLALLMLVLASFIGLLMLAYGGMTKLSGGSKVLTETTETKNKGFFSKRKKTKDSITTFGKDMADFGKALLMVVAAITILILPLTIIGNLKMDVFIQGMAGLGIIMGLLVGLITAIGFTFKSSSTGQIWSMIGLMAALGILIFVMLEMVKSVGTYLTAMPEKPGETANWAKFLLGVVSVFGILAALIVGIKILATTADNSTDLLIAAAGIAIMAASIVGIALAIKMIADAAQNSSNAVLQAAAFMAGIVILAGLYIGLINYFLNPSDIITAAVSFTIMAAGVIAVAAALALVAAINPSWDNAFQVILTMVVLFAAMGILGKLHIAAELVVLSTAMIGMAAAFAIVCVGLIAVTGAIMMLVKAAEEAKDGWDSIERGITLLTTVAIILGIVVIVLGIIGAIFAPAAVGALMFAGAVFLLALAFYLVVQAIIDLATKWELINSCLSELSTWLEEHKDEWTKIMEDFTSLIVTGMIGAVETILSETSVMVEAVIGILKQGWSNYFKDLGAQIYDARQENKRLESLDTQAKEDYRSYFDTSVANMQAVNNGVVDWATATSDAFNKLIANENVWSFAREDELIELFNGSFDPMFWGEDKPTTEEIIEAYIRAGGTFIDSEGNQISSKSRQREAEAARSAAYKTSMEKEVEYQQKNSEYLKRINANINDNYKDQDGRLITAASQAYLDHIDDVSAAGGLAGDGIILDDDKIDGELLSMGDYYKRRYGGSVYNPTTGVVTANSVADGAESGTKQGAIEGFATIFGGSKSGNSTGQNTVDAFWSFFSNGGNATNTAWSLGLKDVADAFSGSVTDIFGKLKDQIVETADKMGINLNFSEGIDTVAKTIGLDTESEFYKKLKTNLSFSNLSSKAQETLTTWQKYMAEGKDPLTALGDAVNFHFDTTSMFNSEALNEVADFLGIKDLLTDENGKNYFGDWSEFQKLLDFTGEENPVAKAVEEAAKNFDMEGILGDTGLGNISLPETSVIPDMNLDDIYSKYGFDSDAFNDMGLTNGDAFMDGLADSMTSNTAFDNASSDIKDRIADYTSGAAKSINTVLRYQDGVLLEAAATVNDLGLVTSIFQKDKFTKKQVDDIAKKGLAMREAMVQIQTEADINNATNTGDFWEEVKKEHDIDTQEKAMLAKKMVAWDPIDFVMSAVSQATMNSAINNVEKNGIGQKVIGNAFVALAKASKTAQTQQTQQTKTKSQSGSKTTTTSAVNDLDKTAAQNKQTRTTTTGTAGYGTTGTTTQSAAQSAASATDYLASINYYSSQMYEKMINLELNQNLMVEYLAHIHDNTYQSATNPVGAYLPNSEQDKLITKINGKLGFKAAMAARGV